MKRGLAVVLLCTACAVPAALADGDPASDVLITADVYFPIQTPSSSSESALASAVAGVYDHGNRLKVAVVATRQDLGSIPSLYGKPAEYAQFLGQELAGFYEGPLLIVEPAGFGIYDAGRSTKAEGGVLAGLSVDGSSTDALTQSATDAVEKLDAANALKSPDVKPPYVSADPITLRPGKTAKLTYRVLDDSERASLTLTILAPGRTLATLHARDVPATFRDSESLSWAVPKDVPRKGVRICLVAVDASGNRSPRACEPVKVGG
jgi:hypothetical protein